MKMSMAERVCIEPNQVSYITNLLPLYNQRLLIITSFLISKTHVFGVPKQNLIFLTTPPKICSKTNITMFGREVCLNLGFWNIIFYKYSVRIITKNK